MTTQLSSFSPFVHTAPGRFRSTSACGRFRFSAAAMGHSLDSGPDRRAILEVLFYDDTEGANKHFGAFNRVIGPYSIYCDWRDTVDSRAADILAEFLATFDPELNFPVGASTPIVFDPTRKGASPASLFWQLDTPFAK